MKDVKAVVVIPVYKLTLEESEEFSLARCQKILGHYPIIFVAPEGLEARYLEEQTIVYFPAHYFENIQGYNRLMLSHKFYTKFIDFDFMLLYQLDAFVFSDKLLYWCEKDLDYIGATWINGGNSWKAEIKYRRKIAKYIEPLRNKQNAEPNLRLDYLGYRQVGNGGFSLRKIATFAHLTQLYADWINKVVEAGIPEDAFFGYLLNLYKPHTIKTGSYKQGISFAFEMFPSRAYRLNWWRLPFGCHDFGDWEPDFWKGIFAKLKD
jgi:hypothetical protein